MGKERKRMKVGGGMGSWGVGGGGKDGGGVGGVRVFNRCLM